MPAMGDAEASRIGLLSAPAMERALTQVMGSPPGTRFEVRGLYRLEEVYDESYVFVDLVEAQRLFRMRGHVTGIDVRLGDIENAERVRDQLAAQLDPEIYRVLTWYDLQKSLYDVMQLEKWGALVILALIVVVAAFNIVGSLTMTVVEKRRDIGVLKAMGVSRADIRRIFLLEGLLIGGVGVGVGLVLGVGLALLQLKFHLVPLAGAESFLIDAYPVAIEPRDVALVAVVGLVLCMLAAWYPASRAARVEPAAAVSLDL
jgi:lipoprotein-releasing system permease protein